MKVKEALKDDAGYRVYIRNHPLLSRNRIMEFLNKIGAGDYEFADEGSIQEWLPKTHAVISTGGTMAVLEAVVFGTPVIRVIPDNNFLYDALSWPDYPLKPVSSSKDIRRQMESIDVTAGVRKVFSDIGREVLARYFTKPTDENLKAFLLGGGGNS